MAETEQPADRSNHLLPLVALALVLAAWAAVGAGRDRVSRLDLSRWGTDLDIPERLAIDKYCAGYALPYIRTAVALDAAAFAVLVWAVARGRFRILGALVLIVCIGSAAWHGLGWVVVSFFAS